MQARIRALRAARPAQSPKNRWSNNTMDKPKFVYVTYIRTTPEKLWQALTEPEFTRQFWCDTWQDCQWRVGILEDHDPRRPIADSGEILEINPPRRLVLSWRNEFRPELRAEGFTRI